MPEPVLQVADASLTHGVLYLTQGPVQIVSVDATRPAVSGCSHLVRQVAQGLSVVPVPGGFIGARGPLLHGLAQVAHDSLIAARCRRSFLLRVPTIGNLAPEGLVQPGVLQGNGDLIQ